MPVIDKTDRILQDVLDRITPTAKEEQRTQEMVEKVVSATKESIRGKKLDHVIAGSFTRNTWMKDKKEFDIFIRFPVSTSREDLEETGLKLGEEISKKLKARSKVAYAEHPYTRVRMRDYDIDIVPCYRVSSAQRIKSAVDRTPFHNEWLSHHFLKRFAPEVRLLKQFCKAQGVYGSDTKTLGFSGYLCELLIIQYRTFKNLVRAAPSWKPGKTIINLEGMSPITDVKTEHKKFLKQPLLVIDPVDPERNVAAALSSLNFMRFIKACRAFNTKPNQSLFDFKIPDPNVSRIEREFRNRKTTLIGFSCKAPDVIDDVLWPQLRKTSNRISSILKEYEFSVHGFDVWSDNKICIFFFELSVSELPTVRKLRGPTIFSITNSENFKNKYKKLGRLWVEDEYWTVEIKRKHKSAQSLLAEELKGNEEDLRAKGITSHIAPRLAKTKKDLKKSDIVSLARKSKEFGQFLQDYMEMDSS